MVKGKLQSSAVVNTIAVFVIAAAALHTGCYASIHEHYFLSAYDPQTRVTNYFRISLDGSAWLSKSRYSVGFYDRNAVQQLFGENTIYQEYLATSVDVFDSETGRRLSDLSTRLETARLGGIQFRREHLAFASASVAELIGQYGVRLVGSGNLEIYRGSLEKARALQEEAQRCLGAISEADVDSLAEMRTSIAAALAVFGSSKSDEDKGEALKEIMAAAKSSLKDTSCSSYDEFRSATKAIESGDLSSAKMALETAQKGLKPTDACRGGIIKATDDLREAQAILEAIRIAIDGQVLVRFFSGDGLEIDVTSRTLVIFVATDISRFAEALRQLAKSEDATRDIMLTVMGPRIQEERELHGRVLDSDREESALDKRFVDLLAVFEQGLQAAATESERLNQIEATLSDFAAAVAGREAPFQSSDEIRAYINGRKEKP